MYFPHLFARRAELLALRDVCDALPIIATTSPVLEPLKSDSRDLVRCLELLGEAGVSATVIVNPVLGDFKSGGEIEPWLDSLAECFARHPTMLPGFVCRSSTTRGEVDEFLNSFPGREVSLLYWSSSLSTADIQELVRLARIRFHINLHDQMAGRQRRLLPRTKAVDINDHFNHLPRNADYSGQEFFSDDHLTFAQNAIGFGDYSIVGSRFIPGGGPAHAVAIHGVYESAEGDVWVEHFVSDDVDADVGSVEEKYLQAASKLVDAADARPGEFGNDIAIAGFRSDVAEETFPGLAMNKRRQIAHQIALNHRLLGGEA